MRTFVAPAVGYVIGAKSAGEEGKHLARSLEALRKSDESAGVVAAARSQMANSPRDLAARVDGRAGYRIRRRVRRQGTQSRRPGLTGAAAGGPARRPGPARPVGAFRSVPVRAFRRRPARVGEHALRRRERARLRLQLPFLRPPVAPGVTGPTARPVRALPAGHHRDRAVDGVYPGRQTTASPRRTSSAKCARR